jgi:hypothetical protein
VAGHRLSLRRGHLGGAGKYIEMDRLDKAGKYLPATSETRFEPSFLEFNSIGILQHDEHSQPSRQRHVIQRILELRFSSIAIWT